MTIGIHPFEATHLPAAAHLLATNHGAHRQQTPPPLLPAEFADGRHALALLDATWRWPGAAGVVAVDGADLVGFMIGMAAPNAAYVPASGHAVASNCAATVYPLLYAALAPRWINAGCPEHHVQFPITTPNLAPTWIALGFAPFLVLATASLPLPSLTSSFVPIRQAANADLDAVCALMDVLHHHHGNRFQTDRVHQQQMLADPRAGCWLAFDGNEAVGLLTLRPPATAISPLHLPAAAIHLVDLVTQPHVRGQGIGMALCAEALGWAYLIGYRSAALHWHADNPPAERFWRGRGFTAVACQWVRRLPHPPRSDATT